MSAREKEHPRARLSYQDVETILTRAANGERSGVIAEAFGIGKNTVLDILKGRTWKEVPRPLLPERKVGAYNRQRPNGGVCSIPGCNNPHEARGFCYSHWWRWKKHGDPLGGRTPEGEPMSFLEGALNAEPVECVLWPYARTVTGYALVNAGGKQSMASRVVCELAYGLPPAEGLHAAHSCGNGHLGCINPHHLRWATPSENEMDKLLHGRISEGERHPSAKLTWDDVAEIRKLAGSMPQKRLAMKYGVTLSTLQAVIKRKTWKGRALCATHQGDKG